MKGSYLRSIGRRRNVAAIGLINLIYPATAGSRYEQTRLLPRGQVVPLKLLPSRSCGTA